MSFDGNGYAEYASTVITSKGDIIRGNASGKRERYGIGSSNQILQVSSGEPTWQTLSTAGSVLTTQGDILYHDAVGLQRLGQSTDGYVLTTKGAGANPVWADVSASGDESITGTCAFPNDAFHMFYPFVQKDIANSSFTDTWGIIWSASATYAYDTGSGWGLKQTTATGLNSSSGIAFIANTSSNVITSQLHQPFSSSGSVLIWVQQWSSNVDGTQASTAGLMQGVRGDAAGNNAAIFNCSLWSANWQARNCGSAGLQTDVDTTVTRDLNKHLFKIQTSGSDCKYYIDGTLRATITTNLPTGDLTAAVGAQNHTNASSGSSVFTIYYVDGYNT